MEIVLGHALDCFDMIRESILSASIFFATCAFGFSNHNDECVLPGLKKEDALNIIMAADKSINREMIYDINITQYNCNYLVGVLFKPFRPNNNIVYEINKDKKIIRKITHGYIGP